MVIFFRIFSNSLYAVHILWNSFRFYRGLSYPLGIWPNCLVFFRNLIGFSHIRSYSSWFCRVFTIFFGFWEIFPDSLTFSWTHRFFQLSRILSIFSDSFSYPVRIRLDSLVFFWILSDRDFFGLSCILSKSLLILWIFFILSNHLWILQDVEILSDSSVMSPILSIFGRIFRHSLGFFRILLDNLRFFWNLGGFSRIYLDAFRFFRSLTYFLGICPNSLVFIRIISDSTRFSWNLVWFSYILSYFFGILTDSVKFSQIISDSIWLSRIILDSFKFIRILSNSLGFFGNLPFSLGFSRILSHSSKFSTFLSEFHRILPHAVVFFRLHRDLLEFS